MSKESARKKEPVDFTNLDSKAASEAGTAIVLIDPRNNEPLLDDDEKPYFITILGIDSAKLRGISKISIDRRMNSIRKGNDIDYDSDVVAKEKAALYAAATTGWYLPPLDGAALEYSEKNAKRLYSDPRFPWLLEQLDKAIADRQRFFKKASPVS